MILFENLAPGADFQPLLNKVRAAFAPAFSLSGELLRIEPSIGVAFYPEDGQDEASLLEKADRSMYEAKRR